MSIVFDGTKSGIVIGKASILNFDEDGARDELLDYVHRYEEERKYLPRYVLLSEAEFKKLKSPYLTVYGCPVWVVRSDGWYKVEQNTDGEFGFVKLSDEEIRGDDDQGWVWAK